MSDGKVRLECPKPMAWQHPDPRFRALPVRHAAPLWRSRRGYLVHRARSAIVFVQDRGRICITWWCGNSAQNPVPFRPECSEGTQPCVRCEALYQAAQRRER